MERYSKKYIMEVLNRANSNFDSMNNFFLDWFGGTLSEKKPKGGGGKILWGGGEDFLELEARRSNMSDMNPGTVCTYMSSSEVTQM